MHTAAGSRTGQAVATEGIGSVILCPALTLGTDNVEVLVELNVDFASMPTTSTALSPPGFRWLEIHDVQGSAANLTRIIVDGEANNTNFLQVTVTRPGARQDRLMRRASGAASSSMPCSIRG